jgi:hypothetical protein
MVADDGSSMSCTECTRGTMAFRVPEELRDCLPENAGAAALCVSCLTLQPPAANEHIAEEPDLTEISDAFPAEPDPGVSMALLVGLLESLALNRPKLERLVARVEEQGHDPMLILERLADDPELNPAMDLRGRGNQLEQLMDA